MPTPGSSDMVLPDWAPTVTQVAAYVPHRTLEQNPASVIDSEDTYEYTFTVTTRPTAEQVLRLIADGSAWAATQVRPMHLSSQDAARVVATTLAAASVERGWPEDDFALQRANDLEKRADTLLAALIVSNDAANAGDGDAETVDVVLPYWSFPEPDSRYDSPLYF